MDRARLIALDWGTSNLRACLLGEGGRRLGQRSAAVGVMAVPERRFEAALQDLCGDWIDTHRCPLIASGMVGSRQGWQEAPYLPCPAALADAAAQCLHIGLRQGVGLHIVPGLRCVGADGQHDVMRGEETQLWGAGLAAGSCCVLPGTHSKWAWLGSAGQVSHFQTYMTGELFSVLSAHSILGRLMEPGPARQPAAAATSAAFEQGVALGLAQHAHATHALFAVRSAALLGGMPGGALPDFLSGLLIGIEIGSATLAQRPAQVALLGEDALCARYDAALRLAGVASTRVADDATTRGQWQLALHAGLLEGPA